MHPRFKPIPIGGPGQDQGADAVAAAVDAAAQAIAGKARPGEPAALELGNDPAGVLALFTCWQAGVTPLILSRDCPAWTRDQLMDAAGCRLIFRHGAPPRLEGEGGGMPRPGAGALLVTSGSTGENKIVHRPQVDLDAEARRYIELLGLSATSRIIVIAPLSHAYAFGWACAAMVAGAALRVVEPTHLSAAVYEMAEGGWAVVTPSIARLLAERPLPDDVRSSFRDLQVMVGAGPVDAELDAAFEARFGVRLARNYGSTETGALFAAPAGGPPHAIGAAMPGVTYRLRRETGDILEGPGIGEIEVAWEDGWRPMGDMAERGADGVVTILGRRSEVLRRGDHFVATASAEAVACDHPAIRAARAAVLPGKHGGDVFALDVWPHDPSAFEPEDLSAMLKDALPAKDRPDFIRSRIVLRQSKAGKPAAARRYRLAPAGELNDLVRAYKRAHLAFAFLRTGVLNLLDGRPIEDIANALQLDLGALEFALELGVRWGIVHAGEKEASPATDLGIARFEAELAGGLNSVDDLAGALRYGPRGTSGTDANLQALYHSAVGGGAARVARRLVWRQLGDAHFDRILEVGCGPASYIGDALAQGKPRVLRHWAVGMAADSSSGADISVGPPEGDERFDLCILANGVHWPPLGQALTRLWQHLDAGGVMVVDDVFLDDTPGSADLALDWLTHGGLAFQTLAETTRALTELGGEVETLTPPGNAATPGPWRCVLARKAAAAQERME